MLDVRVHAFRRSPLCNLRTDTAPALDDIALATHGAREGTRARVIATARPALKRL